MPKKETKILLIIALVLNAIFIITFIIISSITKNLITKSIDTENQIIMEIKKQDTRNIMKKDLILAETLRDNLNTYVVPNAGTIDYIKKIDMLAANAAIKYNIKTVTNETQQKTDLINAEELKINMEVMGEWKNIQFFLQLLENYPLKIDIEKASFNKFSDNIVKGYNISQWSGNLEFAVLKFKDTK